MSSPAIIKIDCCSQVLSLQFLQKSSEFIFSRDSSVLKAVESLIDIINQKKDLHAMSDSMDSTLIASYSAALTALSDDACSYVSRMDFS